MMLLEDFLEKDEQKIVAGIRYAKKIQDAILCSREDLKDVFGDFSIVYEPKDIVSGDFYYAHKKENKKYLFVGDCTGHGVPGALMSILCNDLVIRALKKYDQPDEVLQRINHLLIKKLKTSNEEVLTDGMDCSLAVIDYDKNVINFAGANNCGVLINKSGKANVICATKNFIGFNKYKSEEATFELKSVPFEKGDLLYLFTDGFMDQFDFKGEKFGKKRFLRTLMSIGKYSLAEQQEKLNVALKKQLVNSFQIDDVLVLGVKL